MDLKPAHHCGAKRFSQKNGGWHRASISLLPTMTDLLVILKPNYGEKGKKNCCHWDFQAPPRTWDPLPIQASHTTPLRIPKDMGMVWVPLTRRGSCYWEFPWTKTGLDTGAFQSDQLKQHQNRISRFQTIFFVMFPMKIIMCFPSKETSVTCLSFLLNLVLLTKKWWLQPSLAATHCI